MWKNFCRNPVVSFLASLKLAVCVIVALIIFMTYGTIIESKHGAEFAKASVYFSTPFLTVQIFLFLNILFAALVRLPFQKRLTGFYIVHSGLLLILIGAAITALYGIDGSLELIPDQPAAHAKLNDPRLHLIPHDGSASSGKAVSLPLPLTATPDGSSDHLLGTLANYDVYLEEYLPYANAQYTWEKDKPGSPLSINLWVTLANERVTQPLMLSNADENTARQSMGPLTLEILTGLSNDCLQKALSNTKANYLFISPDRCVSILAPELQKPLHSDELTFTLDKAAPYKKISVAGLAQSHSFYPQMSTFPITEKIDLDKKSGVRLFDLDNLRKSASVLFLEDGYLLYGKGSDWQSAKADLASEHKLPWMGLNLTLNRIVWGKHQKIAWSYAPPISGKEHERGRAARIRLVSKSNPGLTAVAWINADAPTTVELNDNVFFQVMIGPNMAKLPYQFELSRFKMDMNPGTSDPASYESFVKVTEGESTSDAHVFMNNPLKKGGFTFYQASYFQLEDGRYGSIFSVNRDPGRGLKYGGSLFLVLGSVVHYILRSKKTTLAAG